MELSKRLQAVAGLVSAGGRLVDVGTDHGYIPIYLVQNKKIPSAIAMDMRKGPLSRAEEHIAQAGLEAYITCRLSDGLEKLQPQEGDSLLIAGMGGNLITRILMEKPEVRDSFQELILQPQSAQALVRKTMEKAGWSVAKEDMVLEDGKFYPMLRLVQKKKLQESSAAFVSVHLNREQTALKEEEPYRNEAEYAYGKLLLRKKHPVLKEYLEKRRDALSALAVRLRKQPEAEESASVRKRLLELEQETEVLKEALEYYK